MDEGQGGIKRKDARGWHHGMGEHVYQHSLQQTNVKT